MDAQDAFQLADTAQKLMAAKLYSLASCVMLFYDIMLTFADEVEIIWMQPRWSHMTLLWALNRYITPLAFIVVTAAFHMDWPSEVCDRYVLFPAALKVVTASVVGTIFVIRLYAIYNKSRLIAGFGSALLVAQLAVKIWSFTDGTALILPEGLVGCILVGRSQNRFVFTWVAELVFDTIVFAMTLWRTLQQYQLQRDHLRHGRVSLIALIMRDGIAYFAVIFGANALTVGFYVWAPRNLKAMNATFGTLITSLMVSRLILNLKTAVRTPDPVNLNTSVIQTYEEAIEMRESSSDIKLHPIQLNRTNLLNTRQEMARIASMSLYRSKQ